MFVKIKMIESHLLNKKYILYLSISVNEIINYFKLRVQQNHLLFQEGHKAQEACQGGFLHIQHQDSLHSKQMRVPPFVVFITTPTLFPV